MLNWIKKNKTWLFSGVAVSLPLALAGWFFTAEPKVELNASSDNSIHQSHTGTGDNIGRDKIILNSSIDKQKLDALLERVNAELNEIDIGLKELKKMIMERSSVSYSSAYNQKLDAQVGKVNAKFKEVQKIISDIPSDSDSSIYNQELNARFEELNARFEELKKKVTNDLQEDFEVHLKQLEEHVISSGAEFNKMKEHFTEGSSVGTTKALASCDSDDFFCLRSSDQDDYVDVPLRELICDPDDGPVAFMILSVTSDEPTRRNDDDLAPDAAPDCIGTDIARLRPESDERGDGRVYMVTFVATHDRGGRTEMTLPVLVPPDQHDDCIAVDSGQKYDATKISSVDDQM